MKNSLKQGIFAIALGASSLAMSATHASAFEVVTSTVDSYLFNGGGGANSDYAFRFDLSSDANWNNFQFALNQGYAITDFNLHVWLTPADSGFNSDRHRFFTTDAWVTDNADSKLTPINGGGMNDQVVRLKQELGIYLDGVNYFVGQPTEYEFDLVDWYSTDEMRDLVLANIGIVNIGSADDSYVLQGKLTVTAIANPEPASLLLFGSGLVGLAAWRLRKNQH